MKHFVGLFLQFSTLLQVQLSLISAKVYYCHTTNRYYIASVGYELKIGVFFQAIVAVSQKIVCRDGRGLGPLCLYI